MLKRMLTLLVALSASALAQNTPTKTTLIKAGRVLDVKAGIYLPNQGVLVAGDRINDVGSFDSVKARDPLKDVSELKRVRFVMKGGEVVKNELPK